MELPHIGRNCVVCNRNDYLPFKCTHCDKVICIDHRTNHGKDCPINETKFEATQPENFESLKQKCDFCKRITLKLELTECHHCKLMHCLYHRHQVQHTCSKLDEDKKTREAEQGEKKARQEKALDKLKVFSRSIQTPPASQPAPKPNDPKNRALAKRIRVMRIKQFARGPPNVLTEDKLHFEVKFLHNPKSSFSDPSKDQSTIKIYTTKKHTVGRMIDWVAAEFDLRNKNHVADASQLVFQKISESDDVITLDSQREFGDILNKDIEEGDELLLTYQEPSY